LHPVPFFYCRNDTFKKIHKKVLISDRFYVIILKTIFYRVKGSLSYYLLTEGMSK